MPSSQRGVAARDDSFADLVLFAILTAGAYAIWRFAIKPYLSGPIGNRIPTPEEINAAARRFRQQLEDDEQFRSVLDHPLTRKWLTGNS